jgi:hypothetical protein
MLLGVESIQSGQPLHRTERQICPLRSGSLMAEFVDMAGSLMADSLMAGALISIRRLGLLKLD